MNIAAVTISAASRTKYGTCGTFGMYDVTDTCQLLLLTFLYIF